MSRLWIKTPSIVATNMAEKYLLLLPVHGLEMKLSVSKTFISFTSHPAPSIYLACVTTPLNQTGSAKNTINNSRYNHVSAVKLETALLSVVSYHLCHLCNSPPTHTPLAQLYSPESNLPVLKTRLHQGAPFSSVGRAGVPCTEALPLLQRPWVRVLAYTWQ